MQSERLKAREWLNKQTLNADRHLYVVMSNASDAKPLQAYYQQDATIAPLPIWDGTPYADWREVMPYLGELTPDSAFLDWIDSEQSDDWGWLALSPYPADTVMPYLKGLTQVRMPDASEVFFRFWDGRHLLPILKHLDAKAAELLPVFDQYLINGQSHSLALPPLTPAQPYPWWKVPAELLKQLSKEDPTALVDNLMQWLEEDVNDLYLSWPERNLRLKIEHFVRRNESSSTVQKDLLDYLIQELEG